MRILVTFAVDAEFAPWRRRRPFSKIAQNGAASLFQTEVAGHHVRVLLTGIGNSCASAALSLDDLPGKPVPEVVVSAGLTGALDEGLHWGDIVVPRTIRTLHNEARAEAHPMLFEKAVGMGAKAVETMITATGLVATAADKARLAFFGEAVEMESAIILSRFAAAEARVIALRAVSDAHNEDLPVDFERCLTPRGAIKPMNLLQQMVRRPAELPRLIAFGKHSYAAAQKLGQFLDLFVAALPSSMEKAVA